MVVFYLYKGVLQCFIHVLRNRLEGFEFAYCILIFPIENIGKYRLLVRLFAQNVCFLGTDYRRLLPMILVRNQIGDMLGGETGKFTCRKNKVKFGISSTRIPLSIEYILVQCASRLPAFSL
jgi:hypothetical protein